MLHVALVDMILWTYIVSILCVYIYIYIILKIWFAGKF